MRAIKKAVEIEIAPCPHCGGSVVFWQDSGGRGTGDLTSFSARCAANYNTVILASELGTNGTKRSAISQWNKLVKNGQIKVRIAQ